MNKVILLFLIFFATSTFASIYSCKSPQAKPTKTENSIKTELLISHMPPYITSNEVNVQNLDPKSPALIYYAIDTEEDFMQFSVRYEIAKLQSSCKRNSNVQFVAFLNSLYVKSNSFILCKDKKLSQISLATFPKLNKILNSKRSLFSRTETNSSSHFSYHTNSSSNDKSAFYNYPLAHPDFLFELLDFTTTNTNIFPNNRFAPFLNLKSHGSSTHVLAGLHKCQEEAKKLSSEKIIQGLLTKSEYELVKSLNSTSKVEMNIEEYERIISKLDLVFLHDVPFNSEHKLGEDNLGLSPMNDKNELSRVFSGLGVDEGLGSSFSFGTDQNHLSKILNKLYKKGSERTLGFLMLESCESSRNPSIYHGGLTNIFGYYTSKKSLWYRNLNWWEMLEKSKGKTVNLVNILQEETPKIPNIEVVNK